MEVVLSWVGNMDTIGGRSNFNNLMEDDGNRASNSLGMKDHTFYNFYVNLKII